MDLAAKDAYIQKLAKKVFSQPADGPRKRPFGNFKGKTDGGPPKKKKCKKQRFKEKRPNEKTALAPKPQPRFTQPATAQEQSAPPKQNGSKTQITNGVVASAAQSAKGVHATSSFTTIDVLRKRLHEKIEEARGQGTPKDPSSEAVQAKRAKRKLERERKKQKKKEFRMKRLAEKNAQNKQEEQVKEEQIIHTPAASKRNEVAIIFNKVETVEDRYVDKTLEKKNKKKSVKGQITPLTGKNYKQLLSRVEARKTKLKQLREKDEGKARAMEEKMRWTNLLYKAEGVKIKDDEAMLRASLKKKEKLQAQRKVRWGARSENVIEKMQQRQDKRRRNIQNRKNMKKEKKKEKARKRGRVLPEDLEKAAV